MVYYTLFCSFVKIKNERFLIIFLSVFGKNEKWLMLTNDFL